MEFRPIDLTELIGVVMGTSIVLLPIVALTFRYALKPVVEALGKVWLAKEGNDRVVILEKRVALLERQLEAAQGLDALSASYASPRMGAPAD